MSQTQIFYRRFQLSRHKLWRSLRHQLRNFLIPFINRIRCRFQGVLSQTQIGECRFNIGVTKTPCDFVNRNSLLCPLCQSRRRLMNSLSLILSDVSRQSLTSLANRLRLCPFAIRLPLPSFYSERSVRSRRATRLCLFEQKDQRNAEQTSQRHPPECVHVSQQTRLLDQRPVEYAIGLLEW